ncbi:MAG: tyrosine-type recombinase/integrase [Moorea sp. SIO3C2]|nr:tyrosine-type recombinase/integrase [Moorena sp. SIO3C2]
MPKKRNPKGTVVVEVRGGTLSLRFRTGGKQHRLALGLPNSLPGKKLAKAKALEIQKDIAFGEFDPTLTKYRPNTPAVQPLSTVELFEKYIESRRADGTSGQAISARYKPLLSNLKRFGLSIETADHAYDFVQLLRSRQSPRIANQNLTLLKAFGKWVVENSHTEDNPYQTIKPLKGGPPVQNRKPFTLEEIQQFFGALKADPVTAHYHDFCLVLLSLGLRPSEAIGLRWSHINLDKAEVTIRESLSRAEDGSSAGYARVRKVTKTGNIRTLPLSPLLSDILNSRWSLERDADNLVFTTPKGKPIDDRRFREKIWKRTCKAAGIPYRPPYTSRHTLLSHGIETMGWTLPQAAKVAGHSNTRMVAQTYGHALTNPEFPELQ